MQEDSTAYGYGLFLAVQYSALIDCLCQNWNKQGNGMTSLKRLAGAATIGTALLLGFLLFAPPAQAGYVVTL